MHEFVEKQELVLSDPDIAKMIEEYLRQSDEGGAARLPATPSQPPSTRGADRDAGCPEAARCVGRNV